jgi:uncharacterized protein YdaL
MKSKLLIFLAVLAFSCGTTAMAAASRVLILYDQGADKREPALNDARYLANLVGHFNAAARISAIEDYKTGTMEKYDAVFYINYEKQFVLPASFTSDFYRNTRTFCWLNLQLGGLDQSFLKNNFGFHFKEYREDLGFNKVVYRQTTFPKGDDNVNIVSIDDPALAKVIATVANARGDTIPYIIHSKNLWFLADSPFSYASEKDRYIAFADLLHDILGQDHPKSHKALVRIEDVNPSTDPAQLLRVAKFLRSKNIPFAVGLVPVFIDTNEKTEYHLNERPKLLAVLQKIPSYGGSFVLHGFTHQYHGATTDDYEFWDDIADKPVRGDSVENASARIEKGLKECFSNGIYPVLWETPHYFASRNTYIAIKKYFSHVYERRGTMDHLGSDQFFPYPVKDMYGQSVIPENLGYLQIDAPRPQDILDAARLNLSVRDGYASFFFHPFLDISYLKKIVKGLKEMGYEFADVRDFDPSMIAGDKAVVCGTASVRIETDNRYIFVREYDRLGREKNEKIINNEAHNPYKADINSPPGLCTVIKPEEDLEPGFFTKIWRFAKVDLSYFRKIREQKPGRQLNEVMQIAFVNPSSASSSIGETNDLKSLKFSLSVAGVKYTELKPQDLTSLDLRDFDILILPYASSKNLTPDEIGHLKEAISSGSKILFDGPTSLTEAFDIELQEEPVIVKKGRDFQFPDIPLFWPRAAEVRPVYRAQEKDYRVLFVDEESNLPLVVSGKYGKGDFLYFATEFDPYSDRGYSRFPFLLEMLNTAFRYSPLAERKTAEMYFDPGTRQFISIEKLAKLWKKYGIHRIYAGGWHFYDKYTYDYARLIRVCHKNGIMVYCWLEPPMANQKFWNKYPQWREKTAVLKDAKVDWRFLMNITDPECLKKIFAETETLLTKYDWDGVNLAELYFESAGGPSRPENFTPMNTIVRREFRKLRGFDPIDIFNAQSPHYWQTSPADWQAFAEYRKDLCSRLKIKYLDFLSGIRKSKQDFDIVLTVIDTMMTPSLEDYLAEDMSEVLRMQKKYGLTLQVEDPSTYWSGKPERYSILGAHYRQMIKDDKLLALDCNVLDNHKKGAGDLPAEKPTGEEIRQIVYNMSLNNCRPVFYSEETINENDFSNISAVLARNTVITQDGEMQWKITSPYMVTVRTGKKDLITKLDDQIWFAGEGENVIVPAGEHTLKFEPEPRYFDMASLKPRLHFITADLSWATFFNNAIEFSYSGENTPCYAVISKRPAKISVDGKKTSCEIFEADNGFVVRLPGGSHVVRADIGGGLAYLVETSGVVMFSIIIIFGFVTSVLFLGLFILIRLKRKLRL